MLNWATRCLARQIQRNSCALCRIPHSNMSANAFGVNLLPEHLRKRLFGSSLNPKLSKDKEKEALLELLKFGLGPGKSSQSTSLPDVSKYLPDITNNSISSHFHHLAQQQIKPYTDLIEDLLSAPDVPRPKTWTIKPGWTRYDSQGRGTPVARPLEHCMVFDVEVCVKQGPGPVMAIALTKDAWYSWLAPHLIDNNPPEKDSLDTLIPLSKDLDLDVPRLVIGHNVSYDRVRVSESFLLEGGGTRFLDTMAMHIAVAGMSSSQRLLWMSKKGMSPEELKDSPRWLANTSMNNLADVYKLYCKPDKPLDKDIRNIFVTGNLSDIMDDVQNLLNYCAGDVAATYEITQKVFPQFVKRCPHPATLSGMLTMSTVYLPTNSCWGRYVKESDTAFDRMEADTRYELEQEARMAAFCVNDEAYKEDPWLWDFNWTRGSQKTKRARLLQKMDSEYPEFADLFKDGYPMWYQELAEEDEHGEAFLNLSTSKRVVPKLLKLTWKGYPLHYDKVEKWGYLMPDIDQEDVEEALEQVENDPTAEFPLKEYFDIVFVKKAPITEKEESETSLKIEEPHDFNSIDFEIMSILKEKAGKNKPKKKKSANNGDGLDIGIPGVKFYNLPHKNGPGNRVGNPLGKDFLAFVGEGGALGSSASGLARKLLERNIQMSYWRSTRARIWDQLMISTPHNLLPERITSSPSYNPDEEYGAIIPQMVTAGTLTRRAVEGTWLTASNARKDRIGSELKSSIRAPPGYHLVGADVDSQELWLAGVMGDALVGDHGSTPLGWMCLQGEKSKGTDLHSKTAAAAQVTRDQAKILNYGRIYGAGQPFAKLLLMQFNSELTESEAAGRAGKMYLQTKGSRGSKLNDEGGWLWENFEAEGEKYTGQTVTLKELYTLGKWKAVVDIVVEKSFTIDTPKGKRRLHLLKEEGVELFDPSHKGRLSIDDRKLVEFVNNLQEDFGGPFEKIKSGRGDSWQGLVQQTVWSGGSESHTFNRLEEIAMSSYPVTPVLGAAVTRALDSKLVGRNYLPSRINWVVQSTAVDYLHLLLVAMEWLMAELGVTGRFVISIHDEVRYLVPSEERYKAALCLHLANLMVRSAVVQQLGMDNLPASTAFFSSVDVDTVMRKEPGDDCVTPSNVLGLEKGQGIAKGESLDITGTLAKLNQQDISPAAAHST